MYILRIYVEAVTTLKVVFVEPVRSKWTVLFRTDAIEPVISGCVVQCGQAYVNTTL